MIDQLRVNRIYPLKYIVCFNSETLEAFFSDCRNHHQLDAE